VGRALGLREIAEDHPAPGKRAGERAMVVSPQNKVDRFQCVSCAWVNPGKQRRGGAPLSPRVERSSGVFPQISS
jgi:hypothetical protein